MPNNKTGSAPKLPTAKVIHEDIGLPLSRICSVYGFEEERTLKNHLNDLPLNLTARKRLETQADISKILDEYDKEIQAYGNRFPNKGVTARWKDMRPQYEAALVEELRGNEEEFKYMVRLPMELKKSRKECRTAVLDYIEPIFDELPPNKRLKLAYYFNGYVGLFVWSNCHSDLLLNCICLMSQTAKDTLKEYIDSQKLSLDKESIYYLSESVAWCQKIRHGNGKELRKPSHNTWELFREKCNGLDICNSDDEYEKLLGIAALVVLFSQFEIADKDLELIMSYALFLNPAQRDDILHKALDMLTPENLKPPYTLEDVQHIRKNAEIDRVRIRLEHQFGVFPEEELFQ